MKADLFSVRLVVVFQRDKTELFHHRELIAGRPLLFDPSIGDPPDNDPARKYSFPSGGNSIGRSGVPAAGSPINCDKISFGHQFLRLNHQLGKSLVQAFQYRLVFLQIPVPIKTMVDKIGGVKLSRAEEIAFAQNFLKGLLCKRLVLLLGG